MPRPAGALAMRFTFPRPVVNCSPYANSFLLRFYPIINVSSGEKSSDRAIPPRHRGTPHQVWAESAPATRGARVSSRPNAGRVPCRDRQRNRPASEGKYATGKRAKARCRPRLAAAVKMRCVQFGSEAGGCGARRPDDDVQLRRKRHQPSGIGGEALGEMDRGFPAGLQPGGELTPARQGQQFLGGPQRHGRGPGTRALQADFTQVQFR